jgi:O-antigen/teichoic acid export membrane protein
MNLLFNKIIKHELISGTFYIFVGGMFANVFAFLLNLFLARKLSYSDYGTFASLSAIITLAAILAGSVNTIIVRFVAEYFSKNENDKLKLFYRKTLSIFIVLSLLISIIFILLSPLIKSFLNIDNIWYIVLVGIAISIFYMQSINMAFLQGLMKFKLISFLNAVGSLIKLLVGVVLVLLGFKVFSGLLAILVMSVGVFIIAFIPLRFLLAKREVKDVHVPVGEIFKYSLPSFFIVLFLTFFTSADVILVKHFFNAHDAGFYAGLSLIGKVIFYFTGPIPLVMFPLLVKRYHKGENFHGLFYLSLLLVLLPSLAIAGFYFLFPKFVVDLFLGGRDYLSITPYLGIFGIYLSIFSMLNVCVSFFLSINKTRIIFLVITAAISQVVLIYIFHNSFYQVIGVSILSASALLIGLIFYYLKLFGKEVNRQPSSATA